MSRFGYQVLGFGSVRPSGVTEAHTFLLSQSASGSDTDITFDVSGYSYNVLLFEFINFDSTDGADDYMSCLLYTSPSPRD